MKIIKIFATRCQILSLKCTKFNFVWAPPQTLLGELTALPRLLAGFKGLLLRGGEGKGGVKGSPPLFFCASTPIIQHHNADFQHAPFRFSILLAARWIRHCTWYMYYRPDLYTYSNLCSMWRRLLRFFSCVSIRQDLCSVLFRRCERVTEYHGNRASVCFDRWRIHTQSFSFAGLQSINPLKCSGVRQLHLKVFSVIQV